MRRVFSTVALGVALASAACGRGTGNTDTMSRQQPISVSGCIIASNGTYVLATRSAATAVGTSGRSASRYRLIDEAKVGVDRFVNREAQISGKLEQPRQEGAAPNATDAASEAASSLPTIRIAQMTTGGECRAER
jgi:hypothetical protein